ncbi:glycosyltransferase family 4 protein [Candidatus Microgenomates bacterium]|nr:glycosyltransferase family 4 protein [Candidatus Microgenomates bacterium]
MKIAIEKGSTKSGHAIRGVGFYTKNLIHALGNKVDPIDTKSADLSKYDLIHIPHFDPFIDTFPKNIESGKYMVTIHDLIPLLYPKNYPPGLKGKLRYMNQKRKAKNAQAIITDSETSKKDIVRFLQIDPNKIHVVYLAAQSGMKKLSKQNLIEIKKKYNLPEKFVLYIGDINYNKNIPNLVKACKFANLKLVIVGKQAMELENLGQDLKLIKGPKDWVRFVFGIPHPQLAHYKEVLDLVENNHDVLRLGFVPVEDLSGIAQLASVYCQPSLYEGFGLPLLEAFSMDLPVVASHTQVLVEIGADACLYADPYDYKDMGEKLKSVIEDKALKNNLIKKGKERLKNFSWIKTAQETYSIYEKTL